MRYKVAFLIFLSFCGWLYLYYWFSYLKMRNNKKALRIWARKIVTKQSKCYICGSKKQLQAHHNFDKSTFPIFAFSAWNGVPLCAIHHADYHEWRGGYQKYCTPVHLLIYKIMRNITKWKKISKLQMPRIIIKWV